MFDYHAYFHFFHVRILPLCTEERAYQEAYSMVYCGLTDDEALRLAARHNINGHFSHAMTHRDYVRKPHS